MKRETVRYRVSARARGGGDSEWAGGSMRSLCRARSRCPAAAAAPAPRSVRIASTA